jgi:hypothetical protein
MVAADLMRRGYKIALPYGEDWDYDLIVCRDEKLERVQVKYTCSDGVVITVRSRSVVAHQRQGEDVQVLHRRDRRVAGGLRRDD